jgi:hypothetical protein
VLVIFAGQAQQPEYRLDTQRNFGYGAGSNVRGDFTHRIYADPAAKDQIAAVTYRIDGQTMAEVNTPPFEYRYNTDAYPSGWHKFDAVVTTKDGRNVTTPEVALNLLSAAQQNEGMQRIFGPLAVGLVALAGLGIAAQLLFMRKGSANTALGAPRRYGLKGGTICPRCGRPYARHFWSLNLLVGALDRCDYCGKVAVVRRYPADVLAAAERAEVEALANSESSLPAAENAMTEEERMKKLLEDSKYL